MAAFEPQHTLKQCKKPRKPLPPLQIHDIKSFLQIAEHNNHHSLVSA
jgi:hypothetical protein